MQGCSSPCLKANEKKNQNQPKHNLTLRCVCCFLEKRVQYFPFHLDTLTTSWMRFIYSCIFYFCIPQWIALPWLWTSSAALPGCLAEEAWPTSEWLSSGFSCSPRAPTSAGSGPSTRLSSEWNESWQHPDEPASRRDAVSCAAASLWWNKMSSARAGAPE